MDTIDSRLASEDATYRADYFRALAELNGKPQLLLPAPPLPEIYDEDNPWDVVPLALNRLPLTPYNVVLPEHEPDPESRADVLRRVTVRKTTRPGLREVLFDGCLIGCIAQNYGGRPGWVASCSRSTMYWSISDAALALVADAGVLP